MILINVHKDTIVNLIEPIKMLNFNYGTIFQQYNASEKPENVYYILLPDADGVIQIYYQDGKGHKLHFVYHDELHDFNTVKVNKIEAQLDIDLQIR